MYECIQTYNYLNGERNTAQYRVFNFQFLTIIDPLNNATSVGTGFRDVIIWKIIWPITFLNSYSAVIIIIIF